MAEDPRGEEIIRLKTELGELLDAQREHRLRDEFGSREWRSKAAFSVVWVLVAIGGLYGTYRIADKKLPDRYPVYGEPRDAFQHDDGAVAPIPQTSVSPADRALVLSAIETYTRHGAGAGRPYIPADELMKHVVEPLTRGGLVAEEAGKQILSAILDGGTTLATDYFHQRWAKEYGDDARASSPPMPTIVCSPTFNAVPADPHRVRPPVHPARHRPKAVPRLCPAPALGAGGAAIVK